MRTRLGRDLFGGADRNHFTTPRATLGTEIDDPVGGLDDVEVVLDDDHGVAVIAQPMQDFQQLLDVVEMLAGGRLIEVIECFASVAFRQFARQLHALRLAARQGGGVLSDAHIGQADFSERL